jgi:transposase-like protein
MLGVDSFETAERTICGIEIMHMIRKDRLKKFHLSFLELNL